MLLTSWRIGLNGGAIALQELRELLAKGGFLLRKWNSINSKSIAPELRVLNPRSLSLTPTSTPRPLD